MHDFSGPFPADLTVRAIVGPGGAAHPRHQGL